MQKAGKLHAEGKIEEAGQLYEMILCHEPANFFALYALGTIYSEAHRNGIAIQLLLRSLEENPKQPEALNNLAICFRQEGREEQARKMYEMSLSLAPDNHETWSNLAGACINSGCPEKALDYADKSLTIQPDYASAKHHKGLALLELGNYAEAWKWYEGRKGIREWTKRPYTMPEWDGKPVDVLLIHGEQGLGDEILFMGWFSEARKRAKEIVIECSPRLIPLFERSFGCKCVGTAEEANALGIMFDAKVAMGSLPFILGERPTRKAYLKPDIHKVAKYRKRLEALGNSPYIGISWFGGLKQTHGHLRSATLETWKPILKHGTPISLQYGSQGENAEKLGIPHWQETIDDLDELAALVAACDLVVSVCNTTIHLAGALGVPVWIFVPKKPAWRYGMIETEMQWYGSAKMYRQGENWTETYQRLENDLAHFCRVSGTKQKVA